MLALKNLFSSLLLNISNIGWVYRTVFETQSTCLSIENLCEQLQDIYQKDFVRKKNTNY